MAVSNSFADFVVEQLNGCGDITTKRMLGALKTDATTRPDFEREGSEPFRPYGDERSSLHYFNVPVSVLEDADALCAWGRKAIAVAAAARTVKPSSKKRRPR